MDRSEFESTITPLLELIYPDTWDTAKERLLELTDGFVTASGQGAVEVPSEKTSVLITYGDAIRRDGEAPLATLRQVLHDTVGHAVPNVHILPMFPYSSDDGFAVVDYRVVNPDLGAWSDIEALSRDYALMFDFVANHVSASCPWFTEWLAGNHRYDGYFIEYDAEFDASIVTRPRTSPLFHEYPRADGSTAKVWTTFSDDQIDINVASIPTLVEMTDILLLYLARGSTMIRLDAIGFLWKESGTRCMHLVQTHAVVKLWRAVVDYVRPGTQIITETNVPRQENVSYFGDGQNEAHQVYQFALPPLVMHAFVRGDASVLSDWASAVTPVSDTATYFNFLASHDGVGMRGSEGILSDEQRKAITARVIANGGRASMKSNPDGTQSVYELNINYLDALVTTEELSSPEVVAAKGLAAHSILCSMMGVPAIYYHSLYGSGSDIPGMEASGINRRINREVLDADVLTAELVSDTRRRLVFEG
ncbi:MAG TPA: alpha-amylase family glycosyl hydrolase, partial [Coriobacteriia bacterium]|nr:alpha-amylase family glycosyl hydrolase [Coriobacteriia bacterium]